MPILAQGKIISQTTLHASSAAGATQPRINPGPWLSQLLPEKATHNMRIEKKYFLTASSEQTRKTRSSDFPILKLKIKTRGPTRPKRIHVTHWTSPIGKFTANFLRATMVCHNYRLKRSRHPLTAPNSPAPRTARPRKRRLKRTRHPRS